MTAEIKTLFETRSEIPLFYIESGSRLWGIASPDSDFDVRGFHLKSKAEYFDFRKTRDLIEIMDGDFDFVSYDLDKMFGLLAKSNPTVFEWIRAHIVYWNALPDFDNFQKELIEKTEVELKSMLLKLRSKSEDVRLDPPFIIALKALLKVLAKEWILK